MEQLQNYRKRIDEIDEALLSLFEERFNIIRAVGQLKAKNDIAIVQSKRAQEVINRAASMAAEKNIPPEFIRDLYTRMIDLAHVIENEILETHDK